jgi:DUF4097 and DUF4098 domain-containing protein YvlB
MRRGSVVGPLILIALGALFLVNNLHPELSVIGVLARFWPFVLIGWGLLRLIEILLWWLRRKPMPIAGVSGGEWVLVVFISVIGSGLFFVNQRTNWPPFHMRMKGIEMFGEAYDYPIPERNVPAGKTPRVVVENPQGNARIIGADTENVVASGRKTVRAFHRDEADRSANALKFEVVSEAGTIYVRTARTTARDDRFVTADLEIRVPEGARVECRGRRGDFDVTNVKGDVDIQSDNAGVRLEGIGGKVRVETQASDIIRATNVQGTVDLKGYGHDVELDSIEGQVTVSGNYFGDVLFRNIPKPVRFEGGVRSRTTELRVEACPGQIEMARGDVSLERVIGPVVVNARSKDVQVTDFTESLQLKVDRGDVEIRPGRTPLPTIDVATESGNIELSLPENARFTLKATAKRGEVENDFGGGLKAVSEDRGAVLSGSVGNGTPITLMSERGSIHIRRGNAEEIAKPLPPRPPIRPEGLQVERN